MLNGVCYFIMKAIKKQNPGEITSTGHCFILLKCGYVIKL